MKQNLPGPRVLFLVAMLLAGSVCAEQPGVDINKIKNIYISAEPGPSASSMARMLQRNLATFYKLKVTVVKGMPEGGRPGMLIGRKLVIDSGMVNAEELDAVKFDGYVIKAEGGRIALAGYRPQGTTYAAYRLLRELGIKLYLLDRREIISFEPLENGILKAFRVSSKPFFDHRDLLNHIGAGRYGCTIRQYALGDPRRAANPELFKGNDVVYWDHTAPYLVPKGLYYDKHPEYFAMHDGERIPKGTRGLRVTLCMSNPAVHKIAAERAVEWMDIQNERRFFAITDGDAKECRCPQCKAMDPIPGEFADRVLNWVNSIAREVKKKHPDNVCITYAYGNSTNPPLAVRPDANVMVMYCPWFWNSRTTSNTTWATPLNVTAMKQFMAWAMLIPDQMGVYDYPTSYDTTYGTAARIKWYAKNRVRGIYFNGGKVNTAHLVWSRLMWDPFLDTEKLVTEYCQGIYGPAGVALAQYLTVKKEALDTFSLHRRALRECKDADALEKMWGFLNEAQKLAGATEDRAARGRALQAVLKGRYLVLRRSHPRLAGPALRSKRAIYRKRLEQYFGLYQQLVKEHGYKGDLVKAMSRLGLDAKALKKNQAGGKGGIVNEPREIFERTLTALDEMLDKPAAKPGVAEAAKSVTVRFDVADEASKWLSDGSMSLSKLFVPVESATITAPDGAKMAGAKITAPLSKLPAIPKNSIKMHMGRFYFERVFEKPVDIAGNRYLSFHLHASSDVPVTFYVNDVRSDLNLHAGEQIVRIDFANYRGSGIDPGSWLNVPLDQSKWDKKVRKIGVDIWPQDNFHPHHEARDTEIVLLSMTAGDSDPDPKSLPHHGKAIWLSQFRSNIPHEISMPSALRRPLMRRTKDRYNDLGDWGTRNAHERFRTFTSHRAISPIYAIRISEQASAPEREAASKLQAHLQKLFGVKLPVNPAGPAPGPHTGNVIILGAKSALKAGRITQKELKHVGAEGFVINAHKGRIAIAGPDDAGTAHGVVRYLEDLGVRFMGGEAAVAVELEAPFLHELYLLDWPYFKNRPIAGGRNLKTQLPASRDSLTANMDAAAAARVAEAIKNLARAGKVEMPRELVVDASSSALCRYVAANLLWDPFADATRLIRQFREEVEKQPARAN